MELHEDLVDKTYRHGGYEDFYVNDPKRRHIHKASVRDRLVHHAIYRLVYPFFDRTFIHDSYSCRLGKGTHKALDRFQRLIYTASKNNMRTCWVLKCDVRQFFASIDHGILLRMLEEYVPDPEIMRLLSNIIRSYETAPGCGYGLPLGNLTSQLFANVYLDPLDQWFKHDLKVEWYVRYADDFVVLSGDREWLEVLVSRIADFLFDELKLHLHSDKVFIKTIASGVDFLGWVNFYDHRVLRAKTRKRMYGRILENPKNESLQSYLGLLSHGNTFKLKQNIVQIYWVNNIH